MVKRELFDFNIGQIANSGQCFRINETGTNEFSVVAFGKWLQVSQDENMVIFDCDDTEYQAIWRPYFDLDMDYQAFKSAVPKEDVYLQNAIAAGAGIRILRQELWETIVSFIISQQNNIKRIKKCVESLCTQFGAPFTDKHGETQYAFPTAERLAVCTVEEMSLCKLGYRAKYIISAAAQVVSGKVDLQAVLQMDYIAARNELMKLTGVGIKVSECICLYALHHIHAFPIDTHIKQMLDAHYPNGFPMEQYEGFAGVMQQYGFYYELGI